MFNKEGSAYTSAYTKGLRGFWERANMTATQERRVEWGKTREGGRSRDRGPGRPWYGFHMFIFKKYNESIIRNMFTISTMKV